jgi:competence protein ComEA
VNSPSPDPRPNLIRPAEQALLAAVVALSLAAMIYAWAMQGGHQNGLIEIDRALPIEIQYAVDINAATWPELAQLPQVGETLARRIVESRDTDGPFRDHDDLQRVRGIGPKTLNDMRPYLLPMPADEALVGN